MKSKGILRTVITSSESRYFLTESHFKDNSLTFIFKKFERILNAIYLLTNHIDQVEPLKQKVRDCAINTLLSISKSVNFNEEVKNQSIQDSLTGIINLQALVETMAIAGMIKETSYLLILKELEDLSKVIFEKVKIPESSHLFRDEFFNVVPPSTNEYKRQNIIKDINNNRQSINQSDSQNSNKEASFDIKNTTEIKDKFRIKDFEISDRRNKIVSFFEEKDKLNLNDIAVLLPGFGEKTIQRELLHLVSIGVLGREGKKRWTQYFLIKKA
jgi:hypothetical protein